MTVWCGLLLQEPQHRRNKCAIRVEHILQAAMNIRPQDTVLITIYVDIVNEFSTSIVCHFLKIQKLYALYVLFNR